MLIKSCKLIDTFADKFFHLSQFSLYMESNAKIFSGTGSQYLAEKIAKKFGEPLGKVNIQRFSDGEIYVEFKESIRGRFVFLIQSTYLLWFGKAG